MFAIVASEGETMPTVKTMTGAIRNVNKEKSFGFIAGEDGTDYFFHRSAAIDESFDRLAVGDRVRFIPSQGAKGPRAERVETV